ncbi:MAG: type II toxin-antitoxin system VapC family toxin [Pseudomonadota bacterium]|nr:type II toxin-antitoxin system VapC family toxin [Pseudomonadota bacterium]
MVKALFDTNILIDFLNGIPQARDEIARYDQKSISIITWMEVLGGAGEDVETRTRDYRNSFEAIPLDDKVADRAVRLRRQHGVRLPDAIVWASAEIHAAPLVTRNTKDFGRDTPGMRVPYLL